VLVDGGFHVRKHDRRDVANFARPVDRHVETCGFGQ
jgi:hypothetical protein